MTLLLPALVAFSVVVYLVASNRLYTALDDGLIARVQAIRSLLPADGSLDPVAVRNGVSVLDTVTTADFPFKIVDPSGRLVSASGRSAVSLPGPSTFRAGPDTSITWGPGKDKGRAAYEPIRSNGQTIGYVVAALPL